MSSINVDFLWLDDYEEFELCFRKDTFSVADCLCQAQEGRQNIFFKTEEHNNLQCCNCMKCNKLFDRRNCISGVLWTGCAWKYINHNLPEFCSQRCSWAAWRTIKEHHWLSLNRHINFLYKQLISEKLSLTNTWTKPINSPSTEAQSPLIISNNQTLCKELFIKLQYQGSVE